MKEFVEKLIGRLEEEREISYADFYEYLMKYELYNDFDEDDDWFYKGLIRAISIVNQLAEEYKDKVIIDGQYCWQTCGANEHCKECNRLSNGSIDYYENYDCLAEEYNNGWIPCSERLPECENGCETKALMFQMKDTGSIKCGYYGEGGFYRDKYFRTYTNSTNGFDVRDVIAWQPLPEPYQKGVGE